MEVSINNHIQNKGSVGLHPKKFMMLMGMVSMCMLFVALTSALIVKKADTDSWRKFVLPSIFLYSTFVIVLSSVFLQFAYVQYKKADKNYKLYMILALVTAGIFCVLQYMGWTELTKIGAILNGNVSGSFVYVVTGFHVVHLVVGMLILLITTIVHTVKPTLSEVGIQADERKVNFEVFLIFWHFLGALWVYLYLFLFIIYN